MFKIYDGRTHFWQWDTDCKLVVEDSSIQQVHFCNRLSECSLVCLTYKENEQLLVASHPIMFIQRLRLLLGNSLIKELQFLKRVVFQKRRWQELLQIIL